MFVFTFDEDSVELSEMSAYNQLAHYLLQGYDYLEYKIAGITHLDVYKNISTP
jgi:hypothetical protein